MTPPAMAVPPRPPAAATTGPARPAGDRESPGAMAPADIEPSVLDHAAPPMPQHPPRSPAPRDAALGDAAAGSAGTGSPPPDLATEPAPGAGNGIRTMAEPPGAARVTTASERETAASAASTAPSGAPGEQVAKRLVRSGLVEGERITVRLEPAELGAVEIAVERLEDGRLAARIAVERPATLELLRPDLPTLTRSLESAGHALAEGGLQLDLGGDRRSAEGDRGSGAPADTAPATSPSEPPPAARVAIAAAGRLDLLV
jgi:flagellar hook-length control protein FliK